MSIIKPSDLLKSALLEKMDPIDSLATQFKDETWNKFAKTVEPAELKVEGIPQDIVNVLVFKIGFEAKEWLKRHLTAFGGKTAKDLLATEKGTKALKLFILRIPM